MSRGLLTFGGLNGKERKMKKILIMLAMLMATGATLSAQDVYNEVRRKAQAALDDDTTNSVVRKISQFKADALDYMLIKMREDMPDSTTAFLDHQAYALNEYVGVYLRMVMGVRDKSKDEQVAVLKLFMDASYSNPLFNDPDTELTLSYFNDESCLTRFSLDTDWRKAMAAVASHKF